MRFECRPPRARRRRAASLRPNSCGLLTILLATILAGGCDDGFSPIAESELQFSVYGYLDASADTQWVRVMPIRSLALTAPTPAPARVTLEHLVTGRVMELRDSLFRFTAPNSEIGSEGVFLHNFWTTEPIEPGATYLFTAVEEDEESAEAVIPIPPEYEVEVWLGQGSTRGDLLRLVGLRHLAFVIGLTRFIDECGPAVSRVSFGIGSPESDIQMIPISKQGGRRAGCANPEVQNRDLWVVGSGDEWPAGSEFSTSGLAVPDVPSNVSNSIGFIGGVLTRLVPYEDCAFATVQAEVEYCKLRYNAASVTLSGTVTDVLCATGGVAGAVVELRELNPEPGEPRKVRFTRSGRAGGYSIGALEEGIRYALSVRRFVRGDPVNQYREHTDTLEFAAGEHVTYDVNLRRLACPP